MHSVPDLGGFGVSFARNSFHPAARNKTLFEAASLQAGLQVHCWVEQAHGDSAATPTHVVSTHAAAPTQFCRRATRRPPMPQPRATFILLATALRVGHLSLLAILGRCLSRNHGLAARA
jgi:hypothetical protein